MANILVCVSGCELEGSSGLAKFTMHVAGQSGEVSSAVRFTLGDSATVINNAVQQAAKDLALARGFAFGGSDKINIIGGAV